MHPRLLQLCPALCNPMDCSLLGSSVHGILQERMLEWVAMPSSRGSSWPKGWTRMSCVSCIADGLFVTEPLGNPYILICKTNRGWAREYHFMITLGNSQVRSGDGLRDRCPDTWVLTRREVCLYISSMAMTFLFLKVTVLLSYQSIFIIHLLKY